MKEIEKLAQEWWIKQKELSISGDPESYNPDPSSFEAGFRKAREMAMVILKANQYMAPGLYEPLIEKLGESEVE